jgi:hypothetical protein
MIEVKLYTRDGHYVSTVLIPPFQKMPEVILWGERFFLYDFAHLESHREDRAVECFAVAAVITQDRAN